MYGQQYFYIFLTIQETEMKTTHWLDGALGKIFVIEHRVSYEKPVVVICHGFPGNHIGPHNIYSILSKRLAKSGISSIRFDFGGFGNSDGFIEDASLTSLCSDLEIVYRFVKSNYSASTGLLGFSMGGAVSIKKSPSLQPNALALWSPLSRNAEVTERQLESSDSGILKINGIPVSETFKNELLENNVFSNARKYKNTVFIVHGKSDNVIPNEHSVALAAEFENSTLQLLNGADHAFSNNDISNKVIDNTIEFFKKTL